MILENDNDTYTDGETKYQRIDNGPFLKVHAINSGYSCHVNFTKEMWDSMGNAQRLLTLKNSFAPLFEKAGLVN